MGEGKKKEHSEKYRGGLGGLLLDPVALREAKKAFLAGRGNEKRVGKDRGEDAVGMRGVRELTHLSTCRIWKARQMSRNQGEKGKLRKRRATRN